MPGPDPSFIASSDWKGLSDLLAALWMILGSALGIGGSMLLAHGMIPSLVATRDIPADLGRKVRVPMYGTAIVFLALLLFSILTFVSRLDTLTGIYYRGAI